jgi:hypothetical protein
LGLLPEPDLDLSPPELPDLDGCAEGAAARDAGADALGDLSGEDALVVSLSAPAATERDDDAETADARDAAELESDTDGAPEPVAERVVWLE